MQADPIKATYSTVGVVGDASLDGSPVLPWTSSPGLSGITGTPAISFQGVSNGSLTEGQSFDLGQFVVHSMAAGTTTTYTNVPFEVAFTENSVTAGAPSSAGSTVVFHGWLNGALTAGSPPHFTVGFNGVDFNENDSPVLCRKPPSDSVWLTRSVSQTLRNKGFG